MSKKVLCNDFQGVAGVTLQLQFDRLAAALEEQVHRYTAENADNAGAPKLHTERHSSPELSIISVHSAARGNDPIVQIVLRTTEAGGKELYARVHYEVSRNTQYRGSAHQVRVFAGFDEINRELPIALDITGGHIPDPTLVNRGPEATR